MKKLILFLSLMIAMVGSLRAETKEQIKEILEKKFRIIDPNNALCTLEESEARTRFLQENQSLIDSLGKNEVLYYLELASERYTDRRVGFRGLAIHATHLYEKFHEEFTEEERKMIALKINEFFTKGWIRQYDLEVFQAAQSKKVSNTSTSASGMPNGSEDISSTSASPSKSDKAQEESTTTKTAPLLLTLRSPIMLFAIFAFVIMGVTFYWRKCRG